MASSIVVPGYCVVKVQMSGSPLASLTELGITRNGVTVSWETFYHDVPGDEFGGDDGPPIDTQFLGQLARIRCEFTKYDRTVMETVLGLYHGSSFGHMNAQGEGTSKYPGELAFTGTNYMRVLLLPQLVDTRNFPRCIIRAPNEQNFATKYASPIVEFEAHAAPTGSGEFYLHNRSVDAAFPGLADPDGEPE